MGSEEVHSNDKRRSSKKTRADVHKNVEHNTADDNGWTYFDGDNNIESSADNIENNSDGWIYFEGDNNIESSEDNIENNSDGWKYFEGDNNIESSEDNIENNSDGWTYFEGDNNIEPENVQSSNKNNTVQNKTKSPPSIAEVIQGSLYNINKEKEKLCTQVVIEGKGSRISQLIKGFDQSINCSYCQQILTGDYVVLKGGDDIKLHSECREKYLAMTRPLCWVCNKPIMEDRWKTYNNENYHTACRPN